MKTHYRCLIIILLLFNIGSALAQDKADTTYILTKSRLYLIPTFSVSNKIAENQNQVVRVIHDQYLLEWEVNFNIGYFFKDNFAVGAEISYGRRNEDISYTADNQDVTENSAGYAVTLSPNIRNYFGTGRFKVFNQTSLIFKTGNEIKRVYNVDDQDKIRTRTYKIGIGLQPGIAFFVDRFAAVEASINLLGWETENRESVTNDTETSRVTTNDVSFRINVLTLNIGIGIYLNELGKNK